MSSSYNFCLGLFGKISFIFQLIKFVNAHGRDLLKQQHFGSHSAGQNQGGLPGVPPHAASSGPGLLGLLFSVMNRLQNPAPTVPPTPQVNLTTEPVRMLLHLQEHLQPFIFPIISVLSLVNNKNKQQQVYNNLFENTVEPLLSGHPVLIHQ